MTDTSGGPEGLFRKYDVRKVNDPEHKHDDCRFFVLDLTHDPTARTAAVAYARSIGDSTLAADLEGIQNDWVCETCGGDAETHSLAQAIQCIYGHDEKESEQVAERILRRADVYGVVTRDDQEAPVRHCCLQRHYGPVCNDGKVMCQICFGRFDQDALAVNPTDGKKWDLCKWCARG